MRPSMIALVAMLVGCGGAEVRGPRTNVAPPRAATGALPPEANTNADPPPASDAGDNIAAVVLWCSQPGGAACTAVQQELGQAPTPAQDVPASILANARDTDDDCSDPELVPLMQRVTRAVGSGGRWFDQSGRITRAEVISDPTSGGGCLSAPSPGDAIAKVHAADGEQGVRFFVRVWEAGDALR